MRSDALIMDHFFCRNEIDYPTLPPTGLFKRWKFYRHRYGIVHATARFVGTRVSRTWDWTGPIVTTGLLRKWRIAPGEKNLNLGGGGNCLRGFLTCDIDPRADVYLDMRNPLPFDSGEIDNVFCEEAIEHIPKSLAGKFLNECARILKANGRIRISTPDLDWLINSLLRGEISPEYFNACFYEHGHKHIYSRAEICDLILRAGFKSVRVSRYRDPSSYLARVDSHADRFLHPPELSQYLDAIK